MSEIVKREGKVPDRYRRFDDEQEMFVLKSLGEGSYYRDIANQLIEDHDEYNEDDHERLCKRIQAYAKSDKWYMYIDEIKMQQNLKMMHIPISSRTTRLQRLENEYQRLPDQQLERIFINKQGQTIRIYRDMVSHKMRILEAARKEMAEEDQKSLQGFGKPTGLVVNVRESDAIMSEDEIIPLPEEEDEDDFSDIEEGEGAHQI